MNTRVPSRGQTMVLFALSLLLLVLLVCMTLSIGMKVREKMEVQAVADAAAYSNAAVTARVYNEIALMSRAQIGHMVSMASVQSLISWSSFFRAQIQATRNAYSVAAIPYYLLLPCCIPGSGCNSFCKCAIKSIKKINKTRSDLSKWDRTEIRPQWDSAEKPATEQVRLLQNAALRLSLAGQAVEYARLLDKLGDQELAKKIVNDARGTSRWADEWSAPSAGDSVALRETQPFVGAVSTPNLVNGHHVYAAMGSRGHSFTTTRGFLAAIPITTKIQQHLPNPDRVITTDTGSGYFNKTQNHANFKADGTFAWADDHGESIVTYGRGDAPCPTQTIGWASATATLRSTDSGDNTDQHRWTGGQDQEPASKRHTLGVCLGIGGYNCPGVWPLFIDYNSVMLAIDALSKGDDNWLQPKNYAVIQRDYGVRGGKADPWNLLFRFRFSRNNSGTVFDNNGLRLSNGLDISKQTGLSAGIAYYHRAGHWKEPPNLLNPYWRATLVPLTVDSQGRDDVSSTLGDTGVGWAGDTFNELRAQGYEGGP